MYQDNFLLNQFIKYATNLSVLGAFLSVLGFILAIVINHPWSGYVTVAGALLILADTFSYWLAMGDQERD